MESFFALTKSLIIRALIIYFITSFFRRPAPQAQQQQQAAQGDVRSHAAFNYFENGTMFDMYVYLSEDFEFKKFNDPASFVWLQDGLVYGDWYSGKDGDGTYTKSLKFKPSPRLQNNGSIYLHTYIVKTGKSPDPAAGEDYAGFEVAYSRRLLNKMKKIRYQKTSNLLTGTTEKSEEEIRVAETMNSKIVSHWHPNLTINFIVDQTTWVKGQIPQPLDDFITFLPTSHTYLPIIFYNDYWNMLREFFNFWS